MSYWKTSMRLHTEGKITDDLEIKRGIFQGDSLSPLILYIRLILLTEQLNKLLSSFSRVGLGVWFPIFFFSEPEGLMSRVFHVGGPCKAHDRLRLAELRKRHLFLGFCLYLFVAVHTLITAVTIL